LANICELKPFTNDFPRADICELIAPDILHQVIKGAFKDHLVDWVEQYLLLTHGKREAERIMDDIDHRYVHYYSQLSQLKLYKSTPSLIPFHRIAAVASFSGLRRFPQGRGFKQWTGDDSKALMKVSDFFFKIKFTKEEL